MLGGPLLVLSVYRIYIYIVGSVRAPRLPLIIRARLSRISFLVLIFRPVVLAKVLHRGLWLHRCLENLNYSEPDTVSP